MMFLYKILTATSILYKKIISAVLVVIYKMDHIGVDGTEFDIFSAHAHSHSHPLGFLFSGSCGQKSPKLHSPR